MMVARATERERCILFCRCYYQVVLMNSVGNPIENYEGNMTVSSSHNLYLWFEVPWFIFCKRPTPCSVLRKMVQPSPISFMWNSPKLGKGSLCEKTQGADFATAEHNGQQRASTISGDVRPVSWTWK